MAKWLLPAILCGALWPALPEAAIIRHIEVIRRPVFDSGELPLGICKGRTTDDQITYHKNNAGTAASELAVAMLAYENAKKLGRGTEIDLIDPDKLARDFAK